MSPLLKLGSFLALNLLLNYHTTFAFDFYVLVNTTFPLTLAVEPACGPLSSTKFTEINTEITPSDATRTIVAFGDSWTSNGSNGTIPVPPMMWPPSPSAGSHSPPNRRASNGWIWVEDMANAYSAKLLDYAVPGAVIDRFAYNTTSPNNKTSIFKPDFVAEANLFFLQGKFLDALIPDQTLYTVAFVNDQNQFQSAGADWDMAFNTYTQMLGELQAFGAKNILIHGMYISHPNVDILQNRVFAYLRDSKAVNGTNFAFVNLERLFTAISNDPTSFGYEGEPTCLVSGNTTDGGCGDPEHSVFWLPIHPSQNTHKLISEYTQAVLRECVV